MEPTIGQHGDCNTHDAAHDAARDAVCDSTQYATAPYVVAAWNITAGSVIHGHHDANGKFHAYGGNTRNGNCQLGADSKLQYNSNFCDTTIVTSPYPIPDSSHQPIYENKKSPPYQHTT